MAQYMAQVRSTKNNRKKKKRRSLFRLSVILLFFIFCISIGFVIYAFKFDASSKRAPGVNTDSSLSSDDSQSGTEDPSLTSQSDTDSTGDTDSSSALSTGAGPVAESKRQSDSYLDSCAFIGDSITTGLSGYKFVKKSNVFAMEGLRIDNITEKTIPTADYGDVLALDGLAKMKPQNVYILLGSNGVSWYKNDDMIKDFSDFIDSVQGELPDANVYIISITPVGTKKESIATPEDGRVLNTEIDNFNSRLLELANQKSVNYLDVNSALKDSSGKLPDSVTTDGMHFNKATYQTFVDYILTHTV